MSPAITREPDAPLLEVVDLRVTLRDAHGTAHRPVRGVTLNVNREETVGIVGESGSGKSTLALALTGLSTATATTEAAVEGEVRFRNEDLLSLSQRELHRIRGQEIAYVFQDPVDALEPTVNIGAQIRTVIRVHSGLRKSDADRRALELLKAVGIDNPTKVFDRYPHELSGGMNQRAMIALAVANEPALLIADEPTSAVDVVAQDLVLGILDKLKRDLGMSMVFISHDLDVVRRVADRIAIMYAGGLVEVGDSDDIYRTQFHWYTRGLLQATPSLSTHYASGSRLAVIRGQPPPASAQIDGCPFWPRCPRSERKCETQPPPLAPTEDTTNRLAACWFPPAAENASESIHLKADPWDGAADDSGDGK